MAITVDDIKAKIFKKAAPSTAEMIRVFDDRLVMERKKPATRETYVFIVGLFVDWLKRPLDTATKDDIDRYMLLLTTQKKAERTLEQHKTILKRFFTDNGKAGIVEHLKFIRPRKSGTKPVLKREELARILNYTEHIRDKALLMFLYESGCRIGEALAVNVGDLHFDENGLIFEVTDKAKTGARKIRLVESVPVIKEYLETHPLRSQKDAPLWVRLGKNKRARLEKGGATAILKLLQRRSGTEVKLHPHLFRRSRATELAGYLSNQQLRQYFGWHTQEMISQYCMPDADALDERVLEINGKQPRQKKRVLVSQLSKPCPRCGERCTAGSMFCPSCGCGMTRADIDKEQLLNYGYLFKDIIRNNPEAKEAIERAVLDAAKKKGLL